MSGLRDCLRCHTMESWDLNALTFDHDRDSRFRLEGAHAALDCQKCHPRDAGADEVSLRLFDVGSACRDCHEDPHHGQFDKTCDRCHTEQGWKGRWLTPFHTADSRFPLKGRHATLSCEQCHRIPGPAAGLAGAKFAGLGHECQSCHADPHQGQMSLACNACHRETGWTGNDLLFSHDRHTSFRLDRLHSALACSACHGQEHRQYRPLPHECGVCHKTQQSAMQGMSRTLQTPPDPHDGRLACTDCHDTNDGKQSMDSYARRCADCHNDEYGQLAYEWARTLERRQTVVEQWMKSRDGASREQVRKDLSEARECGFHNLNLAPTLRSYRAGPARPRERDHRAAGAEYAVNGPLTISAALPQDDKSPSAHELFLICMTTQAASNVTRFVLSRQAQNRSRVG